MINSLLWNFVSTETINWQNKVWKEIIFWYDENARLYSDQQKVQMLRSLKFTLVAHSA